MDRRACSGCMDVRRRAGNKLPKEGSGDGTIKDALHIP
jgi:hypothetical protein